MATKVNHEYHLVNPSLWPMASSLSSFVMLFGATVWMVGEKSPIFNLKGPFIFYVGLLLVLFCAFGWWRDMILESNRGENTSKTVRIGLRYGMAFFILSEIMFFVGWFWGFGNFALFPEGHGEFLSLAGGQDYLDPDGNQLMVGNSALQIITGSQWPPAGTETLDPWKLPMINTFILLLSGTTITWSHHALLENDRKGMIYGLALTIILGLIFTMFQAIEYGEVFKYELFSLSNDIYGAPFFIATGFHGAHVIIGTIFLTVCLIRAVNGGFTKERHLGFESAAWYWHFVDVVWLFLFVFVYVLGNGGYLA